MCAEVTPDCILPCVLHGITSVLEWTFLHVGLLVCVCVFICLQVAPEPLGAELQFEAADETWDTSDCVILDGSGSEAHHEKREAERKRVDAGLEAEKPRKKSKVPDSGPLAFGLEEEVRSPEEERALLESEFAMPVISDLPYDVAELSGPKEFERDDD